VFHGNQYESHIKCISEAQKYMGSLYNAPGKKEGDKQNKWLDTVTEILANYNGPLHGYVQKLKSYDNIPRKEKAFISFVRNSLGLRDEQAAKALWQLIDVRPKTWSGWEAECQYCPRRSREGVCGGGVDKKGREGLLRILGWFAFQCQPLSNVLRSPIVWVPECGDGIKG
jgi:hypothetical protein